MPVAYITIDTTAWQRDEEYPIHPVGSREKQIVICPNPAPYDFLIPTHRYLLKFSNPRAPSQFLSEVMAYRVGTLLSVPVPPTFPAFDRNDRSAAALIEFFLGRPGESPWELVHGGDYCERYFPGFERSRGRDHTLDRLIQIMESESRRGLAEDYVAHWSKVFLFDATIGNTDRHQDNWGLLWTTVGEQPARTAKLTPAFDNGTSLGYELSEEGVTSHLDVARLAKYVARGRHHIRQHPGDPKGFGHFGLIQEWLRRFPESRPAMAAALAGSTLDKVRQAIDPLVQIEAPIGLSENRLCFVLKLIEWRSLYLRELVGI